MLGIIGAMDEEVLKIKEHMEQVTVETYAGMEFHRGMLNGKELVVVRSGIGKVNAGICSQILVDKFGVEGIVNTGVAGSLKNEINIGDIVLSSDAVQHDMDATGFGDPHGQIPRMDSGDQFISDKEKKQWLVDTFGGYCTEMEGAAIAQAAYLNKVPYLVIRAISDKADGSAGMDYAAFEAKAIEHSVKLLMEMVARL